MALKAQLFEIVLKLQFVLESDLLVAVVDFVVDHGVLQVVEVDLAVR